MALISSATVTNMYTSDIIIIIELLNSIFDLYCVHSKTFLQLLKEIIFSLCSGACMKVGGCQQQTRESIIQSIISLTQEHFIICL